MITNLKMSSNSFFQYQILFNENLKPEIQKTDKSKLELNEINENKHSISISIYGSGGNNQKLFMKSLLYYLQIISDNNCTIDTQKNTINVSFVQKGDKLLFLYSELEGKSQKDIYLRLIETFIKSFFHYKTNLTILFIDNNENMNDKYHLSWLKHYLYNNSEDREYYVVSPVKEGDLNKNKNFTYDFLDSVPFVNMTCKLDTDKSLLNKYHYYDNVQDFYFQNIHFFNFLIPSSDCENIEGIIDLNKLLFNFFSSKISVSKSTAGESKLNSKNDVFLTILTDYLSFFFTQVIEGKKREKNDKGLEFNIKEDDTSITLNHDYTNFEESMKIISPGLLTLNPYFSNIPQYSYEITENEDDTQECHISFKICPNKTKIDPTKFKDETNSITVSFERKAVKNNEDIKDCKFYFTSHSKETNNFTVFINHEGRKMDKKHSSLESKNGIFKLVYKLEEQDEDSD